MGSVCVCYVMSTWCSFYMFLSPYNDDVNGGMVSYEYSKCKGILFWCLWYVDSLIMWRSIYFDDFNIC